MIDTGPCRTQTPPQWLTDTTAHTAPESCFFLCSTMRSGSTLLCDALSSTGIAGYPEEYFPERSPTGEVYLTTGAALKDPETWAADWTGRPFEQCLNLVLRSGTTPNGVFATKLRWFNMAYLGHALGARPEHLAEHLDGLFPDLRYVRVTRRDKVRQAVSLVKARQSWQWKETSPQPTRSNTAVYNFVLVEDALRQIVHEECAWEEYFAHAGVTPFTVIYEDLARNYEATIRRLLDYLEIDLPQDHVLPPPRLYKQADATSEEWVERYHRDARSCGRSRRAAAFPRMLFRRRLREMYVLPSLRTHYLAGKLKVTGKLKHCNDRARRMLPRASGQARRLGEGQNGWGLPARASAELHSEPDSWFDRI